MRKFICAAITAALVALPATAFAHAAYKDSDPKDDATVAEAPTSVWAEYTEPVQAGYLHVYDPCGIRVDDDDTEATGYRLTVDMASDRSGVYRVEWRAASAVDPHETRGVFTFTVTNGEACAGAESEEETEEKEQEQQTGGGKGSNGSSQAAGDEQEVAGDSKVTKGDRSRTRVAGKRIRSAPAEDEALELAQQEQTSLKEPGLFENMRWGAFAIALLIAAAVGAAGGRIYAGIMGPRR